MMFVLSYNTFDHASWSIVPQITLDRGPGFPTTKEQLNNCNQFYGKIDLLQSPNEYFVDEKMQNYRYLFSAQDLSGKQGLTCNHWNQETGKYNDLNCGGINHPTLYAENDHQPHVWVAIVDGNGVTLYKDPKEWNGITKNNSLPYIYDIHLNKNNDKNFDKNIPCTKEKKNCKMHINGCITEIDDDKTKKNNKSNIIYKTCWIGDVMHTLNYLSSLDKNNRNNNNWWNFFINVI